jgi:hypothetical protein
MAFLIDEDGATLVRVRYRNFNDMATCKKYFYKYLFVLGRSLPHASDESLTPYVRGLFEVTTGKNLDVELENSGKSLLSCFFDAIVAAQVVYSCGDLKQVQKIYTELVKQLFSADKRGYILRKVTN